MGIWAIVVAGAFFVGVLTANPVVEAAGGWKAAVDDLLAQITSNDAEIADHETRIADLESTPHTTLITTTFSVSGAELTMISSQNSFCALTSEYQTASGAPACEIVDRSGNWILKSNIPVSCTASCLQWAP